MPMALPTYLEVVQAQETVAAANENYIAKPVFVQRGDDLAGPRHGRRRYQASAIIRREMT